MSNTIKLKRGSGSDPSASDLSVGEIAIRTDSGKLFTKKDNGSVAEISGSGGIDDGDKGDITVSNGGDTFTIDNDAVTYAKIQNITGERLLGRDNSGTGIIEELSASAVRTLLNVENGATADQSASEILTLIKTVDGAGSGLDADLLDGTSSAGFFKQSGSWLGDLGSNGFTRENGLAMTGGAEFVVLSKSGQGHVLIDGSYHAYEGGAFYSYQNSSFSSQVGFFADSTSSAKWKGHLKPNADSSQDLGSSSLRWSNLYADTLYGAGSNITALNASNISSGTVAAARLDTATTQSAGNSTTKIATTAFVSTAISNLVDSSPSTLNTLNELAAALGDDANFSTTVTNSIATKLPLAGGTLTGNLSVTGEITGTSDLTLDSTNTDYPRITLHSNATGIRKYAIINGQAWNQDALLVYDIDADQTKLTIEPTGLGINRGANSLSHCLDVGGTAMIRGATEIRGNISLSGDATTTNQNRTISFTGFDKEGTSDTTDNAFIRHTTNTGGLAGSVLEIGSLNDSNDGIAFNTNNHNNNLRLNGNKIWNAGNDGSGSGLDSDLLDGQEGSYYRNAGNINAGTLAAARLPNHSAALLTSGTLLAARLGVASTSESGISAVGNFGQYEGHGTYNNFNTVPAYWGWNYVMGNTNAPNTTSSQWYRCRLSLGSNYGIGSDSGDYSLEMALPRSSHSAAGVLHIRTIEGGSEGSWTTVGDNASLITTGTLPAARLPNHSAALLTSGTIPSARLSASDLLTLIKTVDGGGSGLNADALDSISSAQFLRSDTNDTATGQITLQRDSSSTTDFSLHIRNEQSAPAQIKFSNNATNQNGYFFYDHRDGSSNSAGNSWHFNSDQSSTAVIIDQTSGNSGFYVGTNEVWHAGNDGSGSGLDSDTVDGIQASSFARSDANDTISGNYSFSSTGSDVINFTGAAGSDNRGIAFNGRAALTADQNDGYLRLNNESSFSNGVFTPLVMRADGGFNVGGTTVINGSGNYTRALSGASDYSTLLRSNAADTASGDITFSGGAGAATIGGGSDIKFTNGDWTGNHVKIQQHGSRLYIVGGSSGIRFREGGADRWNIDGSGHFVPHTDSTYNIGSNGTRVANGYFDTLYGDGSNLTGISAGATGGGSDEVFYENGQTVTTSYTITNGKNAMAAGPITINSGVTVTVGSGENLTIV